MIVTHPDLQAAASDPGTWRVRLFYLQGVPDLYITDSDKPVKWNGQIYSPTGVSYSRVKNTRDFKLDTFKVKIDNVDEAILSWVLNNDPSGNYAEAHVAYVSELNELGFIEIVSDSAVTLFRGRITSPKASEEMTFSVKSGLDLHSQRGPRAEQTRECRFQGIDGFKGRNCGYAGSETECNYSWMRCLELNNGARFGGFPDLNEKNDT